MVSPHRGPVITGKPGIRLALSSFGFSQSPLPALCSQASSCAWRSRLRKIPDRRAGWCHGHGGSMSGSRIYSSSSPRLLRSICCELNWQLSVFLGWVVYGISSCSSAGWSLEFALQAHHACRAASVVSSSCNCRCSWAACSLGSSRRLLEAAGSSWKLLEAPRGCSWRLLLEAPGWPLNTMKN